MFAFICLPLIKSQSQVEVETRDQINLLNLVFMKYFQSKRGIDLNREGELRAHATYSPSPNEEKTGSRGPSQACDSGSSGGGT